MNLVELAFSKLIEISHSSNIFLFFSSVSGMSIFRTLRETVFRDFFRGASFGTVIIERDSSMICLSRC